MTTNTTNNMGERKTPPNLLRVIDANLNRLREGLRVVEDIQRYFFNNKQISIKLKTLRHQARIENEKNLLQYRDIKNDVLKETTKSESTRENISSLLISNIKRAQESARVLEESFKLIDSKISNKFKQIRYELYQIEKDIFS